MNENDLGHLSYKELQAIAHTYRVPGNIKKHLLVRTLQAIQSGNELEVDRMLTEVQQTRKKRVKKQKVNAMNVSSTPIHSPNYTISEDCCYTRHQPPYQWVGAEEEIAIRDEEGMRVPNYTEFQQFLLHRLQRDQYQVYGGLSESDTGQASSIVDLRMGAGSSVLGPIGVNAVCTKTNMTIDASDYGRPSSEVELQILDSSGDNGQARPELLKKLLEAPVGANLGEIASPDANSQRIWSLDPYSNNGNPLDDSDTLTADSEIENDDVWDNSNSNRNRNNNNNNNNKNNNNNAINYYCPATDMKNHAYANDADTIAKNTECMGELRNSFPDEAIQPYPFGYNVNTDVQYQCDKWIAANNFVNREASYPEHIAENSRTYGNVYCENSSGNSTLERPFNRDRKYHYNETNEVANYEDSHGIIYAQRANWSNATHSYYPASNAVVDPTGNLGDPYYAQRTAKQPIADVNREYFAQQQQAPNEMDTVQNSCQPDQQSLAPPQFSGHVYHKEVAASFHNHHENNNDIHYNSGYYPQYSPDHTQRLTDFSGAINPNGQQQQSSDALQETNEHMNTIESSASRRNGVLDPFWPRWPINSAPTSNGNLETILNLHNRSKGAFDFSKKNETSCVYCYTEPIVTQRIESTHSWCTRNKPPIAESRQHLFTPDVLIYNDASTGMIMANMNDPSSVDLVGNQTQEPLKDESVNCNGDHDYELRVSDDSSDNSLNDVWIHDYANYPVSSDNAFQSAELTNDENDDDLFSSVRDPSQNSIDDQTIGTFTDISY